MPSGCSKAGTLVMASSATPLYCGPFLKIIIIPVIHESPSVFPDRVGRQT